MAFLPFILRRKRCVGARRMSWASFSREMKKQEASNSTAIIVAHRAVDSAKPTAERICYDPYAEQFAGPGFTVIGEVDVPRETALDLFNDLVPGFHDFFIARTRYMDDVLERSLANGLQQLVILGAGYDSRAYRFKALKQRVRVFEVDHPATQEVKKTRVKDAFGELPGHVIYCTCDGVLRIAFIVPENILLPL